MSKVWNPNPYLIPLSKSVQEFLLVHFNSTSCAASYCFTVKSVKKEDKMRIVDYVM